MSSTDSALSAWLGTHLGLKDVVPGPRLGAAIEALLRTDLALKSSGGDPRILLERLVVELCAPKRLRSS